MSTAEETTNIAVIIEYFVEFWGKVNNPSIVDKLCADNLVITYPVHGPRYSKEAAKKMLAEFKEVCTHTGVAFADLAVGALDEPNTGKTMRFSGTTMFTPKDGEIVDETGEEGALTALQQLGLVKGPNEGKDIQLG
ncbi:hypothetical protein ANO14919_106420 [Xylariales sp. No.14919]|nr:hypothetical protein ANO14919_106420 [Xylariales sp. No.14919]